MGNTQPRRIIDELQNDLIFKDYVENLPTGTTSSPNGTYSFQKT